MPAPRSQGGLGPGDSGDRGEVPSSELSVIWRKMGKWAWTIGHLGLLSWRRLQRTQKAHWLAQDPPQYQAEVQGFPLVRFMLTWSGLPITHILHLLTPSLAPEGVSHLQNPLGETLAGWSVSPGTIFGFGWDFRASSRTGTALALVARSLSEAFCFSRSIVGWGWGWGGDW